MRATSYLMVHEQNIDSKESGTGRILHMEKLL